MRLVCRVAALALTLVCSAWCAGVSRLEGTVRDASQAVVPDALILCVAEETGFRFQAASNRAGNYRMIVPDGHYNIIVARAGFRPIVRLGVLVTASAALREDFELQPGSVKESVTVAGVPDSNQPQTPGATVIQPDDVRGLPRNDGSVTGLLWLAPGILPTPATRGEPGQFSSLGAQPNTNTFSVDGVSANNAVAGGGWPSLLLGARLPGLTALGTTHDLAAFDAIEDVTVEPAGEAASIGQAPGANIIIHTRPGTNYFHGALFGAVRPPVLGANDWFANRYGLAPDAPSLHEEGGSLGGPLRRDRTYFFFAADRLDLRQGYAWTTTVPSLAAREISPGSLLAFLNEFPLPNGPVLPNSLGISQLIGESRLPAALTTVNLRVDHDLSPTERLFLRLANTPSWSESGLTQTDFTQYRNEVAVLGADSTEGRWTQESRLGFSRNEATSTWSVTGGGEPPSPAFYSQYPSLAADFSNVVVGGAGSVSVGQNGRNLQNQWEASHTAAFQTSRHQIRFGVDYTDLQPERSGPASSITVAFGTPTNLIFGPLAPVWVTYSRPEMNSSSLQNLSGFVQDAWRVSSRLNVTFGLRTSSPKAPDATPAPNLYSVDDSSSTVAFSPILASQPLWHGGPIQLAPSVAAAWRLTEHADTILRASWTVFHDSGTIAAMDQLNGIPYQELQTPTGSPLDAYNPAVLVPVQLGYGFSQGLRLPAYQRVNVALQHDWRHRDSVEISYAGLFGTGELRREIELSPSAALGALIFDASNGNSQYNALNAVYRRTLANGFEATVSYSWAHSIDLGSSDSSVFLILPGQSASADRGNSDFDVRHMLHAAMTYSLPARGHGITGRLISDWNFGGIATARSGFPLDVQVSETLDGFAVANYQPGLAAGVPIWITADGAPGGRVLNTNAFLYPFPGIPTLGRNALRAFGAWQADASAEHPIWVRDALHVSFRMDAYNVFNHAQFADPLRYASNPMFGQSQSALNLMFGGGSPGSGESPAFLMGAPRSLQASLRLRF